MQSVIKKVRRTEAYYCEKCGKRLAITMPRHLRKRLNVCECGVNEEKPKKTKK